MDTGTFHATSLVAVALGGQPLDPEKSFNLSAGAVYRSGGFDLNGSWSPLYTVHKVFAGLLDVHAAWGNTQALGVATPLYAGYRPRKIADSETVRVSA